jgi:hypothetical protein
MTPGVEGVCSLLEFFPDENRYVFTGNTLRAVPAYTGKLPAFFSASSEAAAST